LLGIKWLHFVVLVIIIAAAAAAAVDGCGGHANLFTIYTCHCETIHTFDLISHLYLKQSLHFF
jgi:hypothetical protein